MRRRALTAVFGVPAVLLAAWTVLAGKDLNWDLLHYHYYVAHALLDGRFGHDYFAARTESYLNPLGYVPFYLMVHAGWHSVLVSMLLAAIHSVGIGLLFLLSWRLFDHRPLPSRVAYSVLGTALGAASVVFWATAGTSYLDPLLAVPMLGGVLLLLGAQPANAVPRAFAAAALFGLAASLKYSNAFFAIAGVVLAASIPGASWSARIRACAAYAACGALTAAVVAGPWMARLASEFGNPFFPNLNALFGSPEGPPYMLASGRFAPDGIVDALLFPFRMASPDVMSYAEINAPDLRFAVAALAFACLIPIARRRLVARAAATDAMRLGTYFVIAFAAWVGTSGNGRYGVMVLLLVGPCCAYALERLSPRHGMLAIGALLVAQTAVCASISPPRWWLAERWSAGWFGFAVPERAREQPALYLSVEPLAMTPVTAFLHPASSFANIRGQDPSTPGWRRLDELKRRSGGAVRVLGRGLRLQADGKPRPDAVEASNWTLLRFGYRVDVNDCFAIDWQPDASDSLSRWANAVTVQRESLRDSMALVSCALAEAERAPAELAEERRISGVFARVERACPRLFQGQTAVTERLGAEWARNYPALDARMETEHGRVILRPWFKLHYHDLGRLADWEGGGRRPAACGEAG